MNPGPFWTHYTDSTMLHALAYHEGMLFARFHGGTVYQYDGVTGEEFTELVSADSVGQAFNRLVKGAGKPFQRLI